MENLFSFCFKVFTFEGIVVVSGASKFEDFVETPAAQKNHGSLRYDSISATSK